QLIYQIGEKTTARYGGDGIVTEALSFEDAQILQENMIKMGVTADQISIDSFGIKPQVSHGHVESMSIHEYHRLKFG
ncbi:MAG: hypothetical protein AAB557_03775, partial [Patescibacteria group bacterium]